MPNAESRSVSKDDEVQGIGKPIIAHSFPVDHVDVCKDTLPRVKAERNLKNLVRGKIESHYEPEIGVVDYGYDYDGNSLNGFVAAVDFAFRKHYPLVLSPDSVWLAVMQGFAKHVNENAEKLRKMFVKHEGKEKIQIRRDDFVKGNPQNPWLEVFDEFSDKIKDHIGDATMKFIKPEFSTTGDLERAVASITLMDSMQSYFEYECYTLCGIPSVTLTGKIQDWEDIRLKAEQLTKYDLEFWTKELIPVLDELVQAAKGQPNKQFWKNIYKIGGGSGGPYITGWILNFFPYLENSGQVRRNKYLEFWRKTPSDDSFMDCMEGITTDWFPSGLSSAPFVWKYLLEEYKMRFVGGFIGIQQDKDTMALSSQIGWAILDENQ